MHVFTFVICECKNGNGEFVIYFNVQGTGIHYDDRKISPVVLRNDSA